ncbi:MAG: hypothetical protein M3Z24_06505, partial [Chloroflexota bacterium]|nr:hypothetical protein [Chloroflexota bacterium]
MPSEFDNRPGRRRSHFTSLFLISTAFLTIIMVASTFVTLVHHSKGAHADASSFTFTAAGDYGSTSNTVKSLQYIGGNSGANFGLGLGDFNYDTTVSADT